MHVRRQAALARARQRLWPRTALRLLVGIALGSGCGTTGTLESTAVGSTDPSFSGAGGQGAPADQDDGGGVPPAGGPLRPPGEAGGTGGAEGPEDAPGRPPVEENPRFAPAPPTLHRLTLTQYRNAVHALLGAGLTLPTDLEADTPLHGFNAVGASELTISPRAAEQFEAAALSIAAQAVSDAEARASLVGCEPGSDDADCLPRFLARIGRLAWRRPLEPDELEALRQLATTSAAELRDPWQGVLYGLAAILQAPDFLFRVEHGEPEPGAPAGAGGVARRRYTSLEMASRLSFFLWDAPPDDALLSAGERGELSTVEGVRVAAERLLADERAERALTGFFNEYVHLDRLDTLRKDPATFPQMSETLGASMKAEIDALFRDIVFTRDADFGELLTSRRIFVDGQLAALYGLPAPALPETVTAYDLPPGHPRGGLMATAGILALYAHNTVTSPTLRGKFVASNLLCVDIPPPPAGVVTQLPEGDGSPETMRAKVTRHRADPTCNGCHQFMDPMGLALENFDAIGAYRTTDQGLPIDATGELIGETFQGATGLGRAIRGTSDLGACLARRMYRHATGHLEIPGEEPAVQALVAQLEASGGRVKALALALVVSPGFRLVGDATDAEGAVEDAAGAAQDAGGAGAGGAPGGMN